MWFSNLFPIIFKRQHRKKILKKVCHSLISLPLLTIIPPISAFSTLFLPHNYQILPPTLSCWKRFAKLLRSYNFRKFLEIAWVRVYDKQGNFCNPEALIKMDSSANVSLVFSNTSHQSRISMHDYLSKTDQPATFDKLESNKVP